MSAQVATLGLRVVNGEAVADLKKFDSALENTAQKATRAQGQIAQATEKASGATIAGTKHMGAWAALQAEAQEGVGKHSLAIGRLEKSLASFVGHAVGANSTLEILVTSIGKFAVGSIPIAGALIGLSALAFAYEKLTEDARKAKEENQKLLQSIEDILNKTAGGPFGEANAQINAKQAQLVSDVAKMRGIEANPFQYNYEGRLAEARAQVEKDRGELRALQMLREREIAKKEQEDINKNVARQNSMGVVTTSVDSPEAIAREAEKAEKRRLEIQAKEIAEREKLVKESNERIADYNKNVAEIIASDSFAKQWQKDFDEATKLAIKDIDAVGTALVEHIHKQSEESTQTVRHMLEEVQKDFANFFTDIFTKGISSFRDLFTTIKDMFLRLIAEMAAAKIMQKIGVGALASLFPALAQGQSGIGGGMSPSEVAAELARQSTRGQILGAAGAAIGGGMLGYSTGNAGIGMAGGMIMGAQMGGPVGAAAGALAGLVGGLLGASDSARKAAEALKELQKTVATTMDAFRAEVNHDALGSAMAAQQAKYDDIVKQIMAAYPATMFAGQDISGNKAKREKALADAAALEKQKEAEIQAQYADQIKARDEDYRVRLLKAQGHDSAAAKLKLEQDQARERADLIKSFGTEIDSTERATLALLDQVQAQEKLKAATDQASTSALNMVEGYKVQAAIFGAIGGRKAAIPFPTGGPIGDPMFPVTPSPMRPTPLPVGPERGDLTIPIKVDGKTLAQVVLKNFRNAGQQQFGDAAMWPEVQSVS